MPSGSADLESLLARAAESLANATLRLDKRAGERLAALDGRSIQVESTDPAQVFSVRVDNTRLVVTRGPADSPDATVSGRFQDLVAWLAAPSSSAAARVEIDGDTAVPAGLAEIFRSLAPQGLSLPIRGDDLLGALELAGAVAGSVAEGAARAWRQVAAPPLANRDRFAGARAEIAGLREEIEGLAARVAALESSAGGQPEGCADASLQHRVSQTSSRDGSQSEGAPE